MCCVAEDLFFLFPIQYSTHSNHTKNTNVECESSDLSVEDKKNANYVLHEHLLHVCILPVKSVAHTHYQVPQIYYYLITIDMTCTKMLQNKSCKTVGT